MARPILHDYYRSSAAYRVRIALNLKGIDYESRPVNLADGEQKSEAYRALNPQGFVPMLEIDGHRLTQSMAIIGYLDQRFPVPPLLSASAEVRAQVLAMALTVACDIHPLNNLRVLKYLKNELGHSQDEVDAWYAHWISEGLPALEAIAAPRAGAFLFGDSPTIADIRFAATLEFLAVLDTELPDWAKEYLQRVESALGDAYSEPAADVSAHVAQVTGAAVAG